MFDFLHANVSLPGFFEDTSSHSSGCEQKL